MKELSVLLPQKSKTLCEGVYAWVPILRHQTGLILHSCIESKETYSKYLAKLRALKNRHAQDTALCWPLETIKEIRTLQQIVLPASRHHGLEGLPNELFLYILEVLGQYYRYANGTRLQVVRKLSSVSRRFRDGVSQTHSFWTYWHVPSLIRSKFCTTSHLERGAYKGIAIQMGSGDMGGFCQPATCDELACFLSMLSVEKHLDKVLEIEFDANTVGILLCSDKGTQLRPWTFSTVRTLTIVDSVGLSENAACMDRVFSEQGWSFPAVKNLHISGLLPRPQVFKGITRVSFGCLKGTSHSVLRSFMLQLPQLRCLRLDKFETKGTHISPPGGLKDDGFEPFELPRVTSLQASNPSMGSDVDLMRIFEKLRLPNLKNLRLELAGIEWRMKSLSRGASALFTAIQSLEATSLSSFVFSLAVDRHSCVPLIRPLLATQSLEHVVLEYDSTITSMVDSDSRAFDGPKAPCSLRSIRLVDRTKTPPRERKDPYAVLRVLRPLVKHQPEVIIETYDDLLLHQARAHFPRARREWYSDRSVLEI